MMFDPNDAAQADATRNLYLSDSDMPQPPSMALASLKVLRDPSATNSQLDSLLKSDAEHDLRHRILEAANSVNFAVGGEPKTLAQAVMRLGRRRLYDVILTSVIGKLYQSSDPRMRVLWEHAIATGITSHLLAECLGIEAIEEVFAAGLLHDVGKCAVCRRYPGLYPIRERPDRRLHEIEADQFPGLAHAEVGERLMRLWELPESTCVAVLLHHKVETRVAESGDGVTLACLVSVASLVTNNLGLGSPACSWDELCALPCARHLGFSTSEVDLVTNRLDEVFETHHAGFRA